MDDRENNRNYDELNQQYLQYVQQQLKRSEIKRAEDSQSRREPSMYRGVPVKGKTEKICSPKQTFSMMQSELFYLIIICVGLLVFGSRYVFSKLSSSFYKRSRRFSSEVGVEESLETPKKDAKKNSSFLRKTTFSISKKSKSRFISCQFFAFFSHRTKGCFRNNIYEEYVG